jgi:polyisoprenoid-binding protein YceI
LLSNKTIKKFTIMATATKWVIDPTHSEVQFKVKHLVISTVSGFFRSFEGALETETDDFEGAAISFAINIDSVDTNQTQRDEHLKSPDFFDAAKYPQMTFKSTSFKKTGEDDEYELAGDLTIKGVTKSVKLAAEFGGSTTDFYGNVKAGFEVSGKISRKEFGLTWDAVTEAGSIVVGDDIKMTINVQFVKQA